MTKVSIRTFESARRLFNHALSFIMTPTTFSFIKTYSNKALAFFFFNQKINVFKKLCVLASFNFEKMSQFFYEITINL